MPTDLESLLRLILDEEQKTECKPYSLNLPTLVEAELAGESLSSTDMALKHHLTECSDCTRQHQELRALLQLERNNALITPPPAGAFDFSYLQQGMDEPVFWKSFEQASQRVERLIFNIRVFIGEKIAAFDQAQYGLSPQWIASPATRSTPSESTNRVHLLSVPAPSQDMMVNLMVGPVSDRSSNLAIQLLRSSDQQPLGKVRVTLRDADGHILVSQLTETDGHLSLPYLSPNTYSIEVKREGIVWALPLTFAVGPEPSD